MLLTTTPNIDNSRTIIKIIQHNVQAWTTSRKNELCNYYNTEDADILLINSTNILEPNSIKIFNYNVYVRNTQNERHAGIALAIKKNIKHQILDDYQDDMLGVKINTDKGPVIIFAMYSPPRRNYLPVGEIRRTFQKNIPVYSIGDINANHVILGYNRENNKGKIVKRLIDDNIVKHLEPEFNTLVGKKGKPDIVLSNKIAHLNISIEEGSLTTSDHIPMIITLATKPIIKSIQKRRNYKKANWERYKTAVTEKMNTEINSNLLNSANTDKEQIDNAILNWMNIINDSADETIPKTKIMYHIHPKDSDYMKLLKIAYKQMQNLNGWSREQMIMIRNIQEEIKTESIWLNTEVWNTRIKNLNDIYNNPAKFWKDVQKLIGGKAKGVPYIIDNRGNKLYDSREKEPKFREIWGNIFKISQEENQNFDQINERHVLRYLQRHEFETLSYQHTDSDRLDTNNYMTRPTTSTEIKRIIKEFKNGKAPVLSGINKVLLMNLPDIAIDRFRDIINLTLSMGYFPIIFKNGLIILIPKQGKDPKDPSNYRPITLLEVPGKILERVINNRLRRFCEENSIFHPHQYGF